MSKIDVKTLLFACIEAGDVKRYGEISAKYWDILAKEG